MAARGRAPYFPWHIRRLWLAAIYSFAAVGYLGVAGDAGSPSCTAGTSGEANCESHEDEIFLPAYELLHEEGVARVELRRNFLSKKEVKHILGYWKKHKGQRQQHPSDKAFMLFISATMDFQQAVQNGAIGAKDDEVLSGIDRRISEWTSVPVHPMETDFMLMVSPRGPNVKRGDFHTYNASTDEIHIDTSSSAGRCNSVLMYLNDGPSDGATVFPCLPPASLRHNATLAASLATPCMRVGQQLRSPPPISEQHRGDGTRYAPNVAHSKNDADMLRIMDVAAKGCADTANGDAADVLTIVPESGMAVNLRYADCNRPLQTTPSFTTMHARCLHRTGPRSSIIKFKHPTWQTLQEFGAMR
eukprot:TRINITY_DN80464_c0_g1_i1.p1 TRINITY_DN80464_c0_g1~~TRINITY_DN80464_c0_g1_i1.p1  ORF type:complete len:359 (+),score=26.68 TRINITY_DN80464_c0_g1_i1:103-1179(+)